MVPHPSFEHIVLIAVLRIPDIDIFKMQHKEYTALAPSLCCHFDLMIDVVVA